jgi:hypothetical protein
MALKKINRPGQLLAAARHNKREGHSGASRIDRSRSELNDRLAGPVAAAAVAALAEQLMSQAGTKKLRKDAVRAIEVVFSLPAEAVLDMSAYFRAALAWAASRFGGDQNVLSADVHLDEANPHCHVLLLPLVDGRMRGSELTGGRRELADHQRTFREQVAVPFGLRGLPTVLRGSAKRQLAEAVLRRLSDTSDGATRSAAWMAIRSSIDRDPAPFALALGVNAVPAPRRLRTMTEVFTSPGKGPKRERTSPIGLRHAHGEPNHIGLNVAGGEQSLSCVGFDLLQPGASPAGPLAPALTVFGRMLATRVLSRVSSRRATAGRSTRHARAPVP